MRPLLALALLLAGCSKEPAPNVKGLINGKEVPCYSTYNGGFTCHDPDPETVVARVKQDLMPVLTVDEEKGSIKCEAGEQYVEEFEYEIKPKTKGAAGNELRNCLNDPACKQRITSHMRDISNTPDRIKALERRVAELEKRLEVATATRHGWTDYDITDGEWVNVPSERHPVKRFHHEGGAWCNVWADADGIHWEACK